MRPYALLVTWTCYGTWLPGDARGYVSNQLREEGGYSPRENVPGTGYTRNDERTRTRARELQAFPTVLLHPEQAEVVAVSLTVSCQSRHWWIAQAAIMSNHVHVLLTCCADDGPQVRRVLKGTSQAALSEYAGQSRRWWTAGGSDRYKHDERAIEAAKRYVAHQARMLAGVEQMRAFVVANGCKRFLDTRD